MNKKTSILGLVVIFSKIAIAGGPDLSVVNTSGGNIKNNALTIQFSVGEVMIDNIKNYTTGYLQPQIASGPLAVIGFSEAETNSFFAYPNPATNYIYWNLSESEVKKVVIFAVSGNKVLETLSTGSNLNIEGLSSGIYYVELIGAENNLIKGFKIIKN